MKEDKFDERYGIVDLKTGQVTKIPVYEAKKRERWDKVYAKTLADMLDLSSEPKTKVIAYLIRNKDYKNVCMATVRKIAEETGISTKTVQRTLKVLQDNNFIIRLQNGAVMFSPHVMRTGHNAGGMAVLRMWNDEHEVE